MRAISLWQPYLAGVVLGDGWCSRLTIGLRVADEDFARTFALAIKAGYGTDPSCAPDERGYWLVRVGNKSGRFNALLDYEPANDDEKCAWLRGLFDSEGNVTVCRSNVSANAWNRRVAIYSTTAKTLERAERYLTSLGIRTIRYIERPSAGHKGTKVVMQVRVQPGRENFARFAELVGSSIGRKRNALNSIAETYQPDGHCARAQALGAAVRRARRDAGGRY